MQSVTSSKILIVGDATGIDPAHSLLAEVAHALKPHFNNVILCSDKDSWHHLEDGVDLVYVEYSVTDMSGILFFKKMSSLPQYSLIPTIFVSKTKAYDHRVNAFEVGAADFLSRPFSASRIVEMTTSHLKNRRRIFEDGSVKIGNLQFYPNSHSVVIDEQKVKLTDLEYKILRYLLVTPKNVITRDEICQHVWGDHMVNTGRLDTQLYNLKKKIAAFNGKIKSVNKIGMRVLAGDTTFYQEQRKPALQSLPTLAHL